MIYLIVLLKLNIFYVDSSLLVQNLFNLVIILIKAGNNFDGWAQTSETKASDFRQLTISLYAPKAPFEANIAKWLRTSHAQLTVTGAYRHACISHVPSGSAGMGV